jgi:exodeoxyribonuclease X
VIRVIDFETSGVEPPAEVIEMGWCDVSKTDVGIEVGGPVSRLFGADRVPPEARAIHHIAPDDVAGLSKWSAEEVVAAARASGATAIAAHNAEFEGKWLAPALGDLPLVCTYKAALRLWPDSPSHSNQCLRYWLADQGIVTLSHAVAQPAHRAGPDAYVTAYLLVACLSRVNVRTLIQWTREPRLLPTIPIGKQRGAKWADVEEGFLRWMLRTDDMDSDLKWNARRELDRRANGAKAA